MPKVTFSSGTDWLGYRPTAARPSGVLRQVDGQGLALVVGELGLGHQVSLEVDAQRHRDDTLDVELEVVHRREAPFADLARIEARVGAFAVVEPGVDVPGELHPGRELERALLGVV